MGRELDGLNALVTGSSHGIGREVYAGVAYPAAKGGVDSLPFALGAELREHGVRVNAVCPGAKTRLSTGPAYEDKIRRGSPDRDHRGSAPWEVGEIAAAVAERGLD